MYNALYDIYFLTEDYDFFPLYNYSYYDISLVIREQIGREARYDKQRIYVHLN